MQQKRYYDKKANVADLKENQLVFLWKPKKKGTNKFTTKYVGPLKITKKIGTYNYAVVDESSGKPQIVHLDLLRPWPNNLRKNECKKYAVQDQNEEAMDSSDELSKVEEDEELYFQDGVCINNDVKIIGDTSSNDVVQESTGANRNESRNKQQAESSTKLNVTMEKKSSKKEVIDSSVGRRTRIGRIVKPVIGNRLGE